MYCVLVSVTVQTDRHEVEYRSEPVRNQQNMVAVKTIFSESNFIVCKKLKHTACSVATKNETSGKMKTNTTD